MKVLLTGCALAVMTVALPAAAQDAQEQRATPAVNKPLGLTQDAWNARLRERGESRANPGYVRYIYNPANVFPIRTRESMITTIKLPDDEELSQAFTGDDQGFQVGIATPNSVAIKALYPGVDTNLVAYTKDGKIFTFYIRSEGYNSKTPSDFLVDVVMPGRDAVDGAAFGTQNLAEQDARYPAQAAERIRDPYASLPVDHREKYREYAEWSDFHPGTVTEDLGVYVPAKEAGGTIPYRVFHDDRFTYVDYGPNAAQMAEWPTPLVVVQGVEGPVGFRTAGPGGRMLVMEALGSFVLRNGQRVIVIKPRRDVVAGDKTLIEYPTAGGGAMDVPRDLPPGRPTRVVSEPKTVVATYGTATSGGEAPSTVVPLPLKPAALRTTARSTTSATVKEILAPAPAAPVRTVVVATPRAASPVPVAVEATGAAMRAAETPSTVSGDIAAPAAMNQETIHPVTNFSGVATYKVVVGRGTPAQIEDRWKSDKVQYYGLLEGKDMTAEPQADGTVAMAIAPITNIAEGMHLCSSLGTDGSTCTVKPVPQAR